MLRGLTTVSFFADDLDVARRWYAELLGVEPYFERSVEGVPAYLEFRLGDHEDELGIVARRFAGPLGDQTDRPGGAITYWAVDDLEASYARLLTLGATPHQPPIERGPGFVTAAVVDPFGNVLGVMLNQHWLDGAAASAAGA